MSRGRPELLRECIKKAYDLAKFKDNLEFLIKIDNDDNDTINMLKDSFFSKKNLRVFVNERVGFDYLWFVFTELFKLSKGDIIVPISDDLHIKRENWDSFFLPYKDKEVVAGRFSRFIITRKLLEKDDYIKNWTYSTLRGDQDIWRYAKSKGFYIQSGNYFYKKMHKTSREERLSRWKLKDLTILNKLNWKEYNV